MSEKNEVSGIFIYLVLYKNEITTFVRKKEKEMGES